MGHMLQVVRDALGQEPTPEVARRAAYDKKFGLRDRLVESYQRHGPPSRPRKHDADFHPAWLLDYVQVGNVSQHAREFYFVGRALLFAHKVAVTNEFEYLLRSKLILENDLVELLDRTRVYAPFERAGVLFYAPPLDYRQEFWFAQRHSDELLRSYVDFLVAHGNQQINPNAAPFSFSADLAMRISELDALLRACEAQAASIDLYFPPWFPYADFMKFVADRKLVAGRSNGAQDSRDAARLETVLRLPGLDESAWQSMTVEDLRRIRERPAFETWRMTLSAELGAFARAIQTEAPIDAAYGELKKAMQSRLSATLREIDNDRRIGLSVAAPAELLLGVGAAGGAAFAFSGHDAAVAAATTGAVGAAGLATSLTSAIGRWFRGAGLRDSVAKHFRLFAG